MRQHYCQTNTLYVPCVMFWINHNINGRTKMCPNMRQHYCQTNALYVPCVMFWNNHNINGGQTNVPNMRQHHVKTMTMFNIATSILTLNSDKHVNFQWRNSIPTLRYVMLILNHVSYFSEMLLQCGPNARHLSTCVHHEID